MPSQIETTAKTPSENPNTKTLYRSHTMEQETFPMKIFCYLYTFTFTFFIFYCIPTYIAPLIWPKQITNPRLFTYLSIFLNHECAFILQTAIFYIIYKAKSPFFEKYKVEKEDWPWNTDENWGTFIRKVVKTILFNQFFVLGTLLLISGTFRKGLPHRIDHESLPTWREFTLQYIFTFTVNDFMFYLGHWLLHHPKLYPMIHKVHHDNKITYSIAAEYAHPIEFLVGNILVYSTGNIILGKRMHLFSNLLAMQIGIWRTMETHSGYSFTWSPIYITSYYLKFLATPDFHSYHHLRYKGNYAGAFTIWDKYIGETINPKYVYDRMNEEDRKKEDEKKMEEAKKKGKLS